MSSDAIRYRWLDKAELCLVDSTIAERGWTPLGDCPARVLVAEVEGKIVGFHVLQLYPHTEPLHVDEAYRGSGIAEELASQMLDFLRECNVRGFQACADSPFAARLCEANGMTLVESPVYRGSSE